ncbi:TetR/AcrR family transcriptional regulator [Paenibacillaceae bacterium WGS1546]|uniref:TetR/AcrR family transcriptional regulator n=1 Tax=Cohnella sp. WGS1546 TaxID=3366810 RepID=UPI00372D849F
MAAPVNPNDPRVKRTRKAIQQAFLELIAAKDFESITVQDITQRAELNRATFYTHFPDKYELLSLTVDEMFREVLAQWLPPESITDERTLIRNLLLAVCQWQVDAGYSINRRLSRTSYVEENTKKQLYRIILGCLKEISTDPARQERDLEMIAVMISCSIYGVVQQWADRRGSETAETFADRALPFVLSVLRIVD